MGNKKLDIKCRITPYGVIVYALILILAVTLFLIGIFLLPNLEGIVLLVVCALLILYSFCLIYSKYLSYITLNDKTVSTKKRHFAWNEVYITMSDYIFHKGVKGETYFIFFDDHYLSKEEIYSSKVKKNAFYIMVTPKRLELILQNYNKKIQLLNRCGIDRKHLYDKIIEYNLAIDRIHEND